MKMYCPATGEDVSVDKRCRAWGSAVGIAAIAIALACAPAIDLFGTPTRSAERIIANFMEREGIPGAVIAEGMVGARPKITTIGFSDLEARTPMSASSRFRIASLSKPVTAAAIMALVQDGKLSLDEHLVEIVPSALSASDHRYRDITVRHLLQHTGGWDRDSSFDPLAQPERLGSSNLIGKDCRRVSEAMLLLPLQFSPGSKGAYSNLGYCWLQRVVTRRAGESYEGFVQSRIMSPLGLNSFQIGEAGGAMSNIVRHYHRQDGTDAPLPQNEASEQELRRLGGAGGWVASASDYFEFASRPIDIKAMIVPSFAARGESYFGLGWRIWPQHNGPILTHSGFMRGCFSLVLRFPDGNVFVALFNGGVVDGARSFVTLFDDLRKVLGKR